MTFLFRNQFGIYVELGNPKELIVKTFDSSRISIVQYGSIVVCGFILVSTAIAAIVACWRRKGRDVDEGGYKNMTEV